MKPQEYVFLNDRLTPAREACVSVHDRGLLYGDGLFETLRAEGGRPFFLAAHLARLTASARELRLEVPPDFPWRATLEELLQANGLSEGLAAVKILLTRGENLTLGLPAASRPTLIIYARPYTPPPPEEYVSGWPVATFPERRTLSLGRHKSLNYLFCLAARQYALDHGGREALLLEGDGTVSEGAATGLLMRRGEDYCIPQSFSALPSVTLEALRRELTARGVAVASLPVTPAELPQADGLWLANSLMGLIPVAALDGVSVPVPGETARLNALLWSAAAEELA